VVEPREATSSDDPMDRRGSLSQEAIEARAAELQADEGDDHPELSDDQVAKRAAARILEDSEARTQQATDLDPEDDSVIRRTSSETSPRP
jgi:hypothetical protein